MEALQAKLAPFIAHGFLALFGALVHATKAYREHKTKNFLDYLALIFMSSFSGVMFALVGLEVLGETSYITMALAGTGGFIGVEGMSFIVAYLTKKIK